MTIKFVDQVLNITISSLIYGTEIWFAWAFSLYVATHQLERSEPAQKSHPAATPAPSASFSQKEASKASQPKAIVPKETTIKVPSPTPAHPQVQQITCEPVNWKKWKVNDLRKASIARVCGVKSTPVGSRRKLSKADLIAQYEQNLKRMTKRPPASSQKQAQIA